MKVTQDLKDIKSKILTEAPSKWRSEWLSQLGNLSQECINSYHPRAIDNFTSYTLIPLEFFTRKKDLLVKNLIRLKLKSEPQVPLIQKWNAFFRDEFIEKEWKHQCNGRFGGFKPEEISWKNYYLKNENELDACFTIDSKVSWAVKNGHRKFLRSLMLNSIIEGNSITPTQVQNVILNEWVGILKDLLNNGLSINMRLENGMSLAHLSTIQESYPLLQCLISNNINLNNQDIQGLTALDYMALLRTKQLIKDINETNRIRLTHDAHGNTALLWAMLNQDHEIVTMILNQSGFLELKNPFELTTSHIAAIQNMGDVINHLAKINTSIEKRDFLGRTPLHWSVQRGNFNATKTLLALDADPYVKDHFGISPFKLALLTGQEHLISLLVRK